MPGQAVLIDHTHPASHVLVVLDGEIHEDGRTYRPGDIRVSAAGDRHFLRFTRATRCLIVEGGLPGPPAGVRRVLHLPTHWARLCAAATAEQALELATGPEVASALAEWELPSWLDELERHRFSGRLSRARSVGAVARMAGVSREYLSRCYRRHLGASPAEALRAARLRDAYDAVTRSVRPLAEIADACGFSDQCHMTRQFAAWIGHTPGALRRKMALVTPMQDSRPLDRVYWQP